MSRTTMEMMHLHQSSSRNGQAAVPARTNIALQSILRSGMCILTGGRDRQGGAVLTFPRPLPAIEKIKQEDLNELLRFLTSVPSEEVRRHGFTIIIDMRDSTWPNVKALLWALKDHFPCDVRTILVVKPESFSHKPKSTSDNGTSKYGFKVLLMSVADLPKYLNVADLTGDLGGTLHYNHQEWLDIRQLVYEYIGETTKMLDELDHYKTELLNGELANDLRTTDAMVEHLEDVKKQLRGYPIEELEERGHNIWNRLDPKLSPYDSAHTVATNGAGRSIARNPDFQAALSRLRSQLDHLHSVRGQLSQAWQNRSAKLEQCRLWLSFEKMAQQALEWINRSRKAFLTTYTEVGTSLASVKELEKQHGQFYSNCVDKFNIDIANILDLANKLMKSGHYNYAAIRQVADKLAHERTTFQAGLKDRSSVLQLSGIFYKKAEEFAGNFHTWDAACEIGTLPLDSASLRKLILQHEKIVTKSIGQLFAEVHSVSKELSHQMDRHFFFCRRALSDFVSHDGKIFLHSLDKSEGIMASDAALSQADYTRAANQIVVILKNIQRQYAHLNDRCSAKHALLEQEWELRLYQEEVRQVIDWITNAANPFLANNREIGRTLTKANDLKHHHVQFETNAENTYRNAEKLLEASQKLMQREGFNVEDARSSSEELKRQVQDFEARVVARRAMLDTACKFFAHSASLTAHTDRVDRSLEVEPCLDSLESIVEALHRLSIDRKSVLECWADVHRDGCELLRQLRDVSMSQSGDFQHVENVLREGSTHVEALEKSWEQLKQKLDLFCKLRIFERSVAEVTGRISQWSEVIHQNTQNLHPQLAEQELATVDEQVKDLQTLVDEAYDRGQEIITSLECSATNGCSLHSDIIDSVDVQVRNLLEELNIHDENLSNGVEMYRMNLKNAIQLHRCDREGHKILKTIQFFQGELKALPLALLCEEAARRIMTLYQGIQVKMDRLKDQVMQFQLSAEEIARNDLDNAEVAHRLLETTTLSWNSLKQHGEELGRGVAIAVTFYETSKHVRHSLQPLLKEYEEDADWCSLDRTQQDKTAAMNHLLRRHTKQKEEFMKHCNNVRKLSETFLKFVTRYPANHPESQVTLFGVDVEIQKQIDDIKRLEDDVMLQWVRRKRLFDGCLQSVSVENRTRKVIQWMQDSGDVYLKTRTSAGSTQAETEALLNEHHDFERKAKENSDIIAQMMAVVQGLVQSGHSHAARIRECSSMVELRQKNFMSRMDAYRLQLETRLGFTVKPTKKLSVDRSSDGSLEGKLQEMSDKHVSAEEARKTKQRECTMAELLQTERVYVKDLAECVQYFVKEAKSATSGIDGPPGLSVGLPLIFGNIEEIYQFHNKIFLKELEKYEMMPEDVAHCFVTWTPKFDIYVEYCKDRKAAVDKVGEPAFKEYFKGVQAHYSLPNTIDSYLIKPVQRITKYFQLLDGLMKNCVDERHEIRDALEMMRTVPKRANDAMNLSSLENYDEPLEQLGELILVDSFQVSEPTQIIPKISKTHQRQIFFFELAILFTKRICDGNKDPKFIFKNKLLTAGLGITADKKDSCEFALWLGRTGPTSSSSSAGDVKFLLRAPSLDVKTIWIQKLRQIVTDNCVTTSLSGDVVARGGVVARGTRGSRGSKDYEDSLSLEETSGSNERHSIVSDQSSSTTTDSEKGLYEGDWATVTDNYEGIHHDGELTVQKGECVEILERASKGDFYHVRVKSGATKQSHKSPQNTPVHHKVLDGYLPGSILALVPNNRSSGGHLSPPRTMSIDQNHHNDGFGGSSTGSTLPVPNSASDRALHPGGGDGDTPDSSSTSLPVPPTTKRRNTFRKWLTNPVRKLSQNRIDTGGGAGGGGDGRKNSHQLPSISVVPAVGIGDSKRQPGSVPNLPPSSLPAAAAAATGGGSSSSSSTTSSRVKSLFHSSRDTHSTSSSAAVAPTVSLDDIRRASAPPLAVSEVEDLPVDDVTQPPPPPSRHHLASSAPVSHHASLDTPGADLTGVPEMPPPMEQIQAIPGLIGHTLLASSSSPEPATNTTTTGFPLLSSSSSSLLVPAAAAAAAGIHSTSVDRATLSIRPTTTAELAGEIENLAKNTITSTVGQGNSTATSPRSMDDHRNGISATSSLENDSNLSQAKKAEVDEQPTTMPAVSLLPESISPANEDAGNEDAAKTPRESVSFESDTVTPREPTNEENSMSPDPIVRAITMRDYVLRELVDTERDYVKDLGLIIDGYLTYMHENAMPDDMNGREKLIFGNIQQIYVFHRDTFCGELEKCLDAADRLPQVFIRFERKFQMYVVYCQNKPKSEFIVSEYIDTYFEDIRLKLGQKLKLPDMLIKPVQRVMRYQLMLKDIVKYTDRAGLPIRDLQRAIGCIMGVCKLANDFMEVGRLQGFEGNLTAQGKLVLQDSFLVCETFTAAPPPGQTNKEKDKDKDKDNAANNKFKERQIFVFEQVVIFSEAVGGQSHKKSSYSSPIYVYKSQIQVNKMSLIEVPQDTVRFALRSRCPHSGDRMFVCEAPDKEKRDMWVAQIKNMLETQQNFLRALQSPIDFQRRANQQGDEVMTEPAAPLPSTATTPAHTGGAGKPPFLRNPLTFHATDVATADKPPPETRFSKFLRPKSSYNSGDEERRRTCSSVPRTPDSPIRGYSGALTTPITPPPVEVATTTSAGPTKASKFLFPVPSLKVVHSESDLLKKGGRKSETASPSASDSPASGSKTSLTEPVADHKSRRWSISGRRDKPPPSSTTKGSK